ncbi:cytochrome P450 [Neoroseomonas soli]|uniref:Cytochrome P450 n=1 Tax=Neoroseomonas soli TaxID=1081025 RepID=A0A9X9WWR6_9PROT|nr:cytochrome P450 [Neoroseomonas soli]MBR0671595.1 cytochrome P450 [Neoroseomonas soli]
MGSSTDNEAAHPDRPDWDPRSRETLDDQIAAYDALRRRCPVARSDYLNWSFLTHADVMRALRDHDTYSNAASTHLSVPNGMDPPEHTLFRRIIEPYFAQDAMAVFEPACRGIADAVAASLPSRGEIDLVPAVAEDFALKVQCAFMGWPAELHEPLRAWARRNAEATLARDRTEMANVALEFDAHIRGLLKIRRDAGEQAQNDVTTRLMRDSVDGRPLTEAEIVSIVRNWTVGEVGTITASIGIIIHYLAERPALQDQLRRMPAALPAAIDEILRIHAPLIANRRVTTRPVVVGGRSIPAGQRVTLIWASANRDEAVFGDPDVFDPDRNGPQNLLYGAGIHVCPGAPLARLELRLIIEALLRRTRRIAAMPDRLPVRAVYPGSGFTSLPLWIDCVEDAC